MLAILGYNGAVTLQLHLAADWAAILEVVEEIDLNVLSGELAVEVAPPALIPFSAAEQGELEVCDWCYLACRVQVSQLPLNLLEAV